MKIFTMSRTVTGNLVQGPATLMYPKRKREYTKITRGQVNNDIEKCIACGMCGRRCPVYAITVVKGPKDNPTKDWEIDRLKCCTCGLCVEICPKQSLSMTNQYFPPVTERTAGIHKLHSTPPAPAEPPGGQDLKKDQ